MPGGKYLRVLLALVLVSTTAKAEPRKSEVAAECGDIIEGEYTVAVERHDYLITMAPGDVINGFVSPIGDFLDFRVLILEPAGNKIYQLPPHSSGTVKAPSFETGVLSGRGLYRIQILNHDYYERPGNLGVYTIHIGCTLRDGTVIKPGAKSVPSPPTPGPPAPAPEKLPADFRGFPGLGAIDFSGNAFVKLGLDIPLKGTISAGGSEIFGYRFDAEQGDRVTLRFERTSGNINLVLVLLDRNSKVAFQASLVATETLATGLTLTASGEYTLGIARIELLPPPRPSETSFEIEVRSGTP